MDVSIEHVGDGIQIFIQKSTAQLNIKKPDKEAASFRVLNEYLVSVSEREMTVRVQTTALSVCIKEPLKAHCLFSVP
jgi:hypothetical protein